MKEGIAMRPDGTRVKNASAIVSALPYIMPRRYDAHDYITEYAEMEPKQLREELKSIRTAANQISADMFRFLDAKSHGSRQRDDAR